VKTMPRGSVTAPTTFADPAIEARFLHDGYVVLRGLLDPEEVAQARSWHRRIHPEAGHGFFTDLEYSDRPTQEEVGAALDPLWSRCLDAVLSDHRVFHTSFLMKWPDDDSELPLHADWTYVDESRFTSVAFWIGLDDASPEIDNGPLHVLPGSHRSADQQRGTNTRAWYQPWSPYIERHLVALDTRAGDAVVMDNRLVHGSPVNRSGAPRLAIAAAVAPRSAGLRHVVDQGDGSVRVLAVDEDFFLDNAPAALIADPPTSDDLLEIVPRLGRAATSAGMAALGDEPVEASVIAAAEEWERPTLGGSEPPTGGRGLTERSLMWALSVNHRRVARAAGTAAGPEVDRRALPWLDDLEASHPDIRAEYESVGARLRLGSMNRLTGTTMPVQGRWTALVLRHNAGWVAANVDRFPVTVAALRSVPGLRAALVSVLGPGAEITPHRGANNGVVRVHLGLVVPGCPGACALQTGPAWLPWVEGRAFAFDDTWEHRAVNRAAEPRVSLMLEVDRPLDGVDGLVNRLVQPLFRLHPQVRGANRRARDVDVALNS